MMYPDPQERRPHAERVAAWEHALPALITHAKQFAPAYGRLLADVEATSINSLAALASLPITRKSALINEQKQQPPFGGYAALAAGQAARLFASPGPINEPQGTTEDFWRMSRALAAAGFVAGDIVHNCFSYHFTPGGFMLDSGARALGCAVFPGGVGQTELQVAAMRDLGATAYTGTPSFLKIILEKADELGVSLPKLTKAVVTGEALPGSLRQWFTDRGITVRQCYATADLGLIAYETTPGAGMVLDENIIVELVKPGSGEWVAEGEVGEVVVTSFNRDYPLIRFATGDLSAFHPDASPCGRTNRVIKGWMGRADQTAKIKGMFVHPEQIHAIVKRHPEIQHARLVVDRADDFDVMTLQIETTESSPTLQQAVADTMRDITKLRGEVQLCPPQSLARDGKVIDDIRKFE